MKKGWEIKVGDIVHVDINSAQITLCHRAEVLNIPCASVDYWVFMDTDTKNIFYVSERCTIVKYDSN